MCLKTLVNVLLVAALLSACHTRPPRVDCEGRLSPINAPAPVTPSQETHP
jgi:hypothetical protein